MEVSSTSKKYTFASSRNLRFPEKVARKVFEKIGDIKHTYSVVVKRHKSDRDVREAAQLLVSRKPFYRCTFTKIDNYWYANVRRFKGQEGTLYQKDNGIYFPVEDLLKVNKYLKRKLNIKQRE
ncbi:uncharacterized protein LOC124282136 [Haliotis rubra]|uniref:uncharacterized protein LOC124282136 n=1 Tax=Haliotis rubra TaxID=36100 RepID=UPI001EE5432F|nr:uncharacterized protein LOC124282136 [Haliotis rubra]